MTWIDLASMLSGVATAVGVAVGAWQIRESKKLARATFEDALVKEYRDLTRELPTEALMGLPLDDKSQADVLDDFFRYFDLCNEQVFLHEKGRISEDTWTMWSDGIVSNLGRPAFLRAWEQVTARAGTETFSELRGHLARNQGPAGSDSSTASRGPPQASPRP